MIDDLREAVDAVSRPEHTGENRCWPCTAVNAVGVAVVALLVGRRRRALGVSVALLGAAAIRLRGYVVPGTPRFAPRLVEPLPVAFGPDHDDGVDSGSLAEAGASGAAASEAGASEAVDRGTDDPDAAGDGPAVDPADPDGVGDGGEGDPDPEATMEALLDADALVDDEGTLRFAEGFRTALDERVESLRGAADEELAERAAAVAGEDVFGEVHDGRILLDGRRDAWLSRPIAIAETAVGELLRERGVDPVVARSAARPLRAFLETCPACGGPIRDTTLRNCCGGPNGVSGNPERPVRACADCDAVVFTER
ncbi:hypothetical protein DJ83_07480 [Halorubrum ezzemoulense]|uniref:Uncharacterized protein n=1 Tax=Halorubrum ezzemoulense TaxID=337243 RepID=A0A256K566_HALEZ|nr:MULTISPECIES: hypothetical protein [Halorubrum]MDB2225234.1 hypothetical protein [Halorubrum ezzemoulense]OYR61641.1 hypothetical protein DJ83_07480 [Halorubrum ezzemoulense]OYR75993.1 hypothetical protein DJ84_23025 [Halorubrum ezzemoulense]PHQ40887.1 hypothetical protein Z052_17775 [Halorubrum sp. C191]QAY19720.1 hypothetical protein EO776_06675 [Halorubrum ezzemoulense]